MALHRSSRRGFLRTAGLGAAACAAGGSPAAGSREKRPNVLLLYADDLRFDTIHALNNAVIRTPNLDRLTREGTAFTMTHTMGGLSGALCVPSRAMLMTGRTLFHLQDNGAVIPPEQITLGEFLGGQGYETFATGKWHNDRVSFARSFGAGAGLFFGGMADHLATPVFSFDPGGHYPGRSARPAGVFSSTLFSDHAIRFLGERRRDRPFFAYVAYTAPHDPRMAPAPFRALYPPDQMPLPPNFLPQHPFDNGDLHTRDEELAPFPRSPEIVREHIAAYYAMISHLDYEVGRVLAALDASGEAENTLVVFAGDNGLAVGQHGLLGKQNLYDHSVRVPLIFRGPGIVRGAQHDALCYLLDVFPTLCEIMGVSPPGSVEGQSLGPVLRGGAAPRRALFCAYRSCQRMVRTREWKLIAYHAGGEAHTQLFDISRDPWEMRNLAGERDHGARLGHMRALLREHMASAGDPCDPDGLDWGVSS